MVSGVMISFHESLSICFEGFEEMDFDGLSRNYGAFVKTDSNFHNCLQIVCKSKREHFQLLAVVVFSATTNIHNNKQLYESTFELVQKMHKFKSHILWKKLFSIKIN